MQLPVIAEMFEQHTSDDVHAGVLPTLLTQFDAKLPLQLPGAGCATFDCMSVAIPICALVYDMDLRHSALGRGFVCHSDETECKWKESRLLEAAVFVDRELLRGHQDAEKWTKDTFQTTVSEHFG